MQTQQIGPVRVDRILESEGLGFHPGFLLPESSLPAIADEADWLVPHFHDPDSGRFRQSVQAFLIRTPAHVVLVDTCVGNDKERPSSKAWHQQNLPWLERLAAAGVAPEEVDVVLCTHLHVDHVGWNTRLLDGRWVPTFPNARYLFHRAEYDYWQRTREMDPAIGYGRTEGSFEDSVLPVVEAGLMHLVDDGFVIDEFLRVELSAGHSPGHVTLVLSDEDGRERALFTGDILHHPVQCAYPDWNSRYCLDATAARATRRELVERCLEREPLVFAAHFASPTVGRVRERDGRVRFCC